MTLYTKAWDLGRCRGASETRSTAAFGSWSADQRLLGLDAAEKVEHPATSWINLRSVRHGKSRMSDEVPFTAINSRFLQVFKENPDARELVFYGGVGVEQVDQRPHRSS